MEKEIQTKLKEINELYEKLKNDYSLNRAFIESSNNESLKNLVNSELQRFRQKHDELQEMTTRLKADFDYIATERLGNSQTRIQQATNFVSDDNLKNINDKANQITAAYNSIFKSGDGDLVKDFNAKFKKVNELHKSLFESDGKQSKATELETKIDNFLDKYNDIIANENGKQSKVDIFNEKYKATTVQIDKINNFYNKVFGKQDDKTDSLEQELNERLKQLEITEKYAKEALGTSIDAGLASGFAQKAKETKKNKLISLFVFVGILIIMGFVNFYNPILELKNIDLNSIAFRVLLNIPFIWAATVANINLNKYTKLEQEYAHKESLARSFERYKEQIIALTKAKEHDIENAINSNMLKDLIEINLEAFKKNPADTLDKVKSDIPFSHLNPLNKTNQKSEP